MDNPFKLTKQQTEERLKLYREAQEAICEVGNTCRIDYFACRDYLNIENETFHDPLCVIEQVGEDRVYLKAIFTGSGIMFSKTKSGWVPKPELIPSFSIRGYNNKCYIKNIVAVLRGEKLEYPEPKPSLYDEIVAEMEESSKRMQERFGKMDRDLKESKQKIEEMRERNAD